MELGSAGLPSLVLGTSWLPCACQGLLVFSWDIEDVKVGPWGLFGQALSSQLGISLAGNAASKPHPLNEFLSLERKLPPTAIQSLLPSPGACSGPKGLGRKAPTGCMDPWDGKQAEAADSSLFISCLARCILTLVSPRGTGILVTDPCFRTGLGQGLTGGMETSVWVCSRQVWAQIWGQLVLRRDMQMNWGGNHLHTAAWQLILQDGRWRGRHMCPIHRKRASKELSLAQPKPEVFSCP